MGSASGWVRALGLQVEQPLLGRATPLPCPRASLFAAGFECSLYHLLSGVLPESKIASSRPSTLLWLLQAFTPGFRKGPSYPELGKAGESGP